MSPNTGEVILNKQRLTQVLGRARGHVLSENAGGEPCSDQEHVKAWINLEAPPNKETLNINLLTFLELEIATRKSKTH